MNVSCEQGKPQSAFQVQSCLKPANVRSKFSQGSPKDLEAKGQNCEMAPHERCGQETGGIIPYEAL